MRVVSAFAVACFVAVCVLAISAPAAEKIKTVTLEGKILCAKCALKEAEKCTTAIQVKEGDKDVVYYFKDKGNKEEYHAAICSGDRKPGKVTGILSKKDKSGKQTITPTKVVFAEK